MNAFDARDAPQLAGAFEAFGLTKKGRPAALQHHLCLEVVNHLVADGVPFVFQGGTALHTKLQDRVRFSIDLDAKCPDPPLLSESLRRFVAQFQYSQIDLGDPPKNLKEFGIVHSMKFPLASTGGQPVQIQVEVAQGPIDGPGYESMDLQADGFAWPKPVLAPTLDRFMAQKMSTLGPETVGKRVGPNEDFYKGNQGVCKQLFDLRELLKQPLDPAKVREYYLAEIGEANTFHETSYDVAAAAPDAQQLMRIFRQPRALVAGDTPRRDLWRAFDAIRSCIVDARWDAEQLRATAGCVHRILDEIALGVPSLERAARPITSTGVPPEVMEAIGAAQDAGEAWATDDAWEGSALLAWAWAPRAL